MTTTALPPTATPLTDDEARRQARLHAAFADETRLGILHLLSAHKDTLSVADIVAHFHLEQPTISHHLKILVSAGLIDYRKAGLYHFYYLNRTAITGMMRQLNILRQENQS